MRKLWLAVGFLGMLWAGMGSATAAAVCSLPYILANGTIPDATKVMANFYALQNCSSAAGGGVIPLGLGLTTTPGTDNAGPLSLSLGDTLYRQQFPIDYSAATHTVAANEMGHLLTASATSTPVAFTLPAAGSTGFEEGAPPVCFEANGDAGFTLQSSSTLNGIATMAGVATIQQYGSACANSSGTAWNIASAAITPTVLDVCSTVNSPPIFGQDLVWTADGWCWGQEIIGAADIATPVTITGGASTGFDIPGQPVDITGGASSGAGVTAVGGLVKIAGGAATTSTKNGDVSIYGGPGTCCLSSFLTVHGQGHPAGGGFDIELTGEVGGIVLGTYGAGPLLAAGITLETFDTGVGTPISISTAGPAGFVSTAAGGWIIGRSNYVTDWIGTLFDDPNAGYIINTQIIDSLNLSGDIILETQGSHSGSFTSGGIYITSGDSDTSGPVYIATGGGNSVVSGDIILAPGPGTTTQGNIRAVRLSPADTLESDALWNNGGFVMVSSGSPRTVMKVLSASLDYYIDPAGNDANDCLTLPTACATLQHVWSLILPINFTGLAYGVTVHISDGSYAGATLYGTGGVSLISFIGNVATPGNVIITGADAMIVSFANVYFQGMTFVGTGSPPLSGRGIWATSGAVVNLQSVGFGACNKSDFNADLGGIIGFNGSGSPQYTIAGNAQMSMQATTGGAIAANGVAVTLTGTPAFSIGFAETEEAGVIRAATMTFTGTGTGPRYLSSLNGVINTQTGANNTDNSYFPTDVAGSSTNGGQYN